MPVSIDSKEFRELLVAYTRNEIGNQRLIAHIDAFVAERVTEAVAGAVQEMMAAYQKGYRERK